MRGLFLFPLLLFPATATPTANTPTGNRTPVFWLRTRYPRPLDDGGAGFVLSADLVAEHVRRDSNPQPPVLETGALPLELRTYVARQRRQPHQGSSGQGQNRTVDTTIFSRVLYQLSYLALRVAGGVHATGVQPTKSPRNRSARAGPKPNDVIIAGAGFEPATSGL